MCEHSFRIRLVDDLKGHPHSKQCKPIHCRKNEGEIGLKTGNYETTALVY